MSLKVIERGVIDRTGMTADSMYCRTATIECEMEVTLQTDTVLCGFYLDGKQGAGGGGGVTVSTPSFSLTATPVGALMV